MLSVEEGASKGRLICPFCQPDHTKVVAESTLALALTDGFPVSPGHTLIVPRRHFASLVDATPEEGAEIWALVNSVRDELVKTRAPNGFNIGINDGDAAGQTVPHMHVHLIPRYTGDVPDPRGGVRWVIPAFADYWSARDG